MSEKNLDYWRGYRDAAVYMRCVLGTIADGIIKGLDSAAIDMAEEEAVKQALEKESKGHA